MTLAATDWDALRTGCFGAFRVTTDSLPLSDRASTVCEIVDKRTIRQEATPLSDAPFHLRGRMCVLPGLFTYRVGGSPIKLYRDTKQVSDTSDVLMLEYGDETTHVRSLGREMCLGPGDAVLVSSRDESTRMYPAFFDQTLISVPRKALAPFLRNAEDCLARPIPAQAPALRMLRCYMDMVRDEDISAPNLQQAVVAHLYDLLAIALGATRDAAETARNRGVRAARLHAIKKDIQQTSCNGNVSVSDIAGRHRLTPRYVQMLFEESGTTFTEFMRSERLARAYRLLSSPATHDRKILDIAMSCGFGDLSHFNRAFRAQYGATPSEIRALSTVA